MNEQTQTASEQRAANYLRDLGTLLKEKAREAKQRKDEAKGGEEYDVSLGRMIAFQEVVSLMQDQAEAFDLSLDQLDLDDIDPYAELQ